MTQISIIVPVYNCEQFLAPCIDSILEQTYNNLEVILVDDGSSDGSSAICDRYTEQDCRVRCIHQKNSGAAAARNKGLDVASGAYVAFVDSDDWIDPEMYGTMMQAAVEQDCDLVICDCVKEFHNGNQNYTHDLPGGYYDRAAMVERYFPCLLMPDTMEYPVTISNCLLFIRREIIEKHHLRFPVDMRFSEDLLFGSRVGLFASNMTYLKGYTPYHYRQNPNSVTHMVFQNKWPLLLALYRMIRSSFSGEVGYDFTPQIQRCMLFFVYTAMNQRLAADLHGRQFWKEVSTVLDDPEVREALKSIPIFRLNIPPRLKLVSLIYQKKYLRAGVLLLKK